MIAALGFLTVLGRGRTPGPGTVRWFPLAGVLVGAVIAATHAVAHRVWDPAVAGAVVVTVDVVVTGALHVDGLADSADGLLPHMEPERRLEVMRQSDTGAFGIAAVVTTMLLRWSVLADAALPAGVIVALWAASRTSAAVVPALVPYARASGLATAFTSGSSRLIGLAHVPLLALLAAVAGPVGLVAGGVALATTGAILAVARARIGGFTGDVLGACVLLAETAGLLVVAA